MNGRHFLSAFQGLALLERQRPAEVPPALVSSFLNEFIERHKLPEESLKGLPRFDDALAFLEILTKIYEDRSGSRIMKALDCEAVSQAIWKEICEPVLGKLTLHELAGVLWIIDVIGAERKAFEGCE